MRLVLFVTLIGIALGLAAGMVAGRASVVDGDTLEIQGQRIRLWGVDAPEGSQTCLDGQGRAWPCGRRAAFALADYLGQRTVQCQARDTDRYGRMVAVCTVGGVEINRWLVEQGWALDFTRYSKGYYQAAQEAARQGRRGIWQGSFEPPWAYRSR